MAPGLSGDERGRIALDYFLTLLVGGLLSGPVYALVGAALVVVYRASAVLNFSLGEWVSLGARTTGVAMQTTGLPFAPAVLAAVAAMAALAIAFNRIVVARLIGRPVVAVVMATLALGVLMQGGAALTLRGLPSAIPFPLADQYWEVGGIPLPPARLLASGTALVLIGLLMAYFRFSRGGVAIRAVADDTQAASASGIDVRRTLSLAWAISAALAVAGGALWSVDGLGGFGMALVLAKVLPVVVIGGLTSFAGAFIGAIIVGLAETMSAGYLDPYVGSGVSGAITAALVIVTLWLRPAGLFGERAVARV